jgi:hypothetical protein
MSEATDKQAGILSLAFVRIAQNVAIIVTTIGLIVGPIWAFGVNAPIAQLQQRVDKLEGQLNSMQSSVTSTDKSVAVMASEMKNINSQFKDLKDFLKEKR